MPLSGVKSYLIKRSLNGGGVDDADQLDDGAVVQARDVVRDADPFQLYARDGAGNVGQRRRPAPPVTATLLQDGTAIAKYSGRGRP